MSGYNQVSSGDRIKSADFNDLIEKAGGVDGDGWYKSLSARKTVYHKTNSLQYVRDGVSGENTPYSSDITAIQAALDGLTAGRTWMEKVLLLGDITLTGSITPPSYTLIELQGKATLANNADAHMFNIASKTKVGFIGGTYIGNKANQSAGVHVIRAYDSSYVSVRDVTIEDAKVYGLAIVASTSHIYGVHVENCVVKNCDHNNIHIASTGPSAINYGPKVIGGRTEGSGKDGIEVIGCGVYIDGLEAYNNGEYGISVDVAPSDSGIETQAAIMGCSSHGNTLSGIGVTGTVHDIHAIIQGNKCYSNTENGIAAFQRATIIGNDCYDNTLRGIQLNHANASRSVIIGNKLFDNVYGMYLNEADELIVEGNQCYDSGPGTQTYGIYITNNCDYPIIVGNNLRGNVTAGMSYSATNGLVRNNLGYVTENGGTATLLNGNTEVTVTHGIEGTPDAEDIDVHPIETLNNASFWWVDTITSTTFKIKVNANPGQDVDFKWSVRRI